MFLRRISFLFLISLFFLPLFSDAAHQLERWRKTGLVFAERNDDGEFLRWGKLTPEQWDDGTQQSSWVARHEDGTFVTGFRGFIEKWEAKGGEQLERLVVRDAEGHFVTWAPMDENITEGWEYWRFKEGDPRRGWTYVVRVQQEGLPPRLLDSARPQLETWSGHRWKVLVVRDTSDGKQNGQIMTWLPGQYEKRSNGEKWIAYRTPTGQWIDSYKLNKGK
ncbi:MAG: hypothetical protein HYW47_05645 [Deltaproteobacteria bacterium]|nr:hypothetical protein [Deltaproteobacteria bacterium]